MKKIMASVSMALVLSAISVAARAEVNLGDLKLWERVRHTMIADATEQIVHTGRGLLLGLIRSTGAEAAVIHTRDTSVANGVVGNNRRILPRIHWFVGTAVTENPVPYPMLYQRGLSVDIDTLNLGEQVTVVYLPLL